MRIMIIFLIIYATSLAQDLEFDKVFTPEGAPIISIVEMNDDIYAASYFSIYKLNNAENSFDEVYNLEVSSTISPIENLFTISGENENTLGFYSSIEEKAYLQNSNGFEEIIFPEIYENHKVYKVITTESNRTFFVLEEGDWYSFSVLEATMNNQELQFESIHYTEFFIESISEDEEGKLWVVADSIEIHDGDDIIRKGYNGFVRENLKVSNNKIFILYPDNNKIYYTNYETLDMVQIEIPNYSYPQLIESTVGFIRISDDELLFYSGYSENGFSYLIKINSVTDEAEIVYSDNGNFHCAQLLNDKCYIGTGNGILITDLEFNNLERVNDNLSGYISEMPYYSENYFTSNSKSGESYGYNFNTSSYFDLTSDSHFGYNFIIGESNTNLIAMNPELVFSEDGGETWQNAFLDESIGYDTNLYVRDLVYHENEIYYIKDKHLIKSSDNGRNWDIVSKLNLDDSISINSFIKYEEEFLISTSNGLYSYTDELIISDFDKQKVIETKIIKSDNKVFLISLTLKKIVLDNYYFEIFELVRKDIETNYTEVVDLKISNYFFFDNDSRSYFKITNNGDLFYRDLNNDGNLILKFGENSPELIDNSNDIYYVLRENHNGDLFASSYSGHIYFIKTVLSVDGNYELKIDKVYPNPASNFIQLQDIQNNSLVEITDISGNTFETRYNSGIDISRVGTGMYFVKYQNTNGEFVTSKFIKE